MYPFQKHVQIFISLFLLFLSACAYKVPVLRMRPAAMEVAGVQKIGVYPVPNRTAHPQALEKLGEKIKETLRLRQFFGEVRLVSDPAKGAKGLDALFRFDPLRFAVLTDEGEYQQEVWEETGRKVQETYEEDGEEKTREVPEKVLRIYLIPYVRKRIEVKLAAELVNLHDQKMLGKRQFENRLALEARGETQIRNLVFDEILLLETANPLLGPIADELVPHLVGEKVKLAAHAACQPGVERVKQGDWRGALTAWQEVVGADPANHAAHYNIAIAQEALKNYLAAMNAYQEALKYSDRKMYRNAVARLKEVIEEDEKVQAQMRGRR